MGPSVRVHVHVDLVLEPASTWDLVLEPTSTWDLVLEPASPWHLVLEPASPWDLVLEHVSTGLSRGSFCCLVTKVETNEEGIFFFICISISAAPGLSCGVWDLVP